MSSICDHKLRNHCICGYIKYMIKDFIYKAERFTMPYKKRRIYIDIEERCIQKEKTKINLAAKRVYFFSK